MKITSIIATSGGAGASSVSIYVAKMLSLLNKKVLIVDLNAQNESIKKINIPRNTNWVQTLGSNEFDILNCINQSRYEGVDVISLVNQAISDVCYIEKKLLDSDFHSNLTDNLQHTYDHIIFDCSAHYSKLTERALRISDQVVGIVEARPQGVSGVLLLLNRIAQARIYQPLMHLKLILNKVDVNNNACRIAVKQYQNIINSEVRSAVFLSSFEYIKSNGKFRLKLPIHALKKMAFMLENPKKIDANKIVVAENNNSLKNKINAVIENISNGTALQNQLDVDSMTNDELSIEVFAENRIQGSELSENIEEFFAFIRQHNLADISVIVDDQGLLIAQDGKMNTYLDHLTVAFNQYGQLLEFANLNNRENGLWVKNDKQYYYLTAISLDDHFYGLIMCCQNKMAAQYISKLNKLLKSVISKGINHE